MTPIGAIEDRPAEVRMNPYDPHQHAAALRMPNGTSDGIPISYGPITSGASSSASGALPPHPTQAMIAQQNYMDYQDETTTVNYQDNSFHVVNTVNAVLMQAPSDRSPEKDQLRKELQELSYTLGAERSQNEALIHDMKTQANLQFQAQERQFQERAARIEAEAREQAQNQVSEALAQSQNTMRDSLLEASERIRKGDLDVRTLQSEVQTLTRRAERSLREALEECGKNVRQE